MGWTSWTRVEIQDTKTSAVVNVKAGVKDAKFLVASDFLGTYDFMAFETKRNSRGSCG